MIARRLNCLLAVTGVALAPILGSTSALAQNYPNGHTIRMVTAAPGGGSDLATRLVAQGLSKQLGSPVIVENKGGAVLAIETIAAAPPDGYSLLLYANAMWIMPLMQKTNYDPIKDFLPITMVGRLPNILVVNPSVPVTTVPELIAYAKANPGKLNCASSGTGSSTHLSCELFKSMTGTNLLHVPFKNTGDAIKDLVGGYVHVMFATSGSVMGQIQGGKLRALGVTTATPTSLVPGVPPVAQSVPGFESTSYVAVFAPAKVQQGIISLLNKDIIAGLKDQDIRDKFTNAGIEVTTGTPDELSRTVKSEMDRLGKVIRDAGIKAE